MKRQEKKQQFSVTAPQHVQEHLEKESNPYEMVVAGINIEFRYSSDAPSLQQKMIDLCRQTRG
ncbi:MAG: hypothetical protein R3Y63_10785 [Eubacteriales bacterium]